MSTEQSAVFSISASTAKLSSAHYKKVVPLWQVPQVSVYTQVYKQVIVKECKLTLVQHALVDTKGEDGVKPNGVVKFGLTPESLNAPNTDKFDVLVTIPNQETVALSENNQVTSKFEIPARILATMELDLAASPRRDARPVVMLSNCGYTGNRTSQGEKSSMQQYDLCTVFVDFTVECSGVAFGL